MFRKLCDVHDRNKSLILTVSFAGDLQRPSNAILGF